jgi:hypothetical protein
MGDHRLDHRDPGEPIVVDVDEHPRAAGASVSASMSSIAAT